MENIKQVILAYHAENQDVAFEIEHKLSPAGFEFRHLNSHEVSLDESLGDRLIALHQPAVLLVSDNFLKSAVCMKNGLDYLRQLTESGLVLPVIVEGKELSEDGTEVVSVPTQFDRVSHIIKYMNFWQEQYLELRKQKREIAEEDTPSFNLRLGIVRQISSTIGEFLRYLRSQPHYGKADFEANHFRVFFEFTHCEEAHQAFAETSQAGLADSEPEPSTSAALPSEKSVPQHAENLDLVNLINAASEDILEENRPNDEPHATQNGSENPEPKVHTPEPEPAVKEPAGHASEMPEKEKTTDQERTLSAPEPDETETKDADAPDSDLDDEDLDFLKQIQEPDTGEVPSVEPVRLKDLKVADHEENPKEEEDLDEIIAKTMASVQSEEGDDENEEVVEDLDIIFGKTEPSPDETETPEAESSIEDLLLRDFDDETPDNEPEPQPVEMTPEPPEEPAPEPEEEPTQIAAESATPEPETPSPVNEEEPTPEPEPVGPPTEPETAEVEPEDKAGKEQDEQAFGEMEIPGVIRRALRHFEEKEIAPGLEILKTAVEKHPAHTQLRFQYALALAKFGRDYYGAVRQLKTLLDYDENHLESYFLLGELAELHHDHLAAKSYFEKVAQTNPDFPNIHYRLGVLLLNHFETESKSAVRHLKKAIKKNKRHADAWYRLGILYNEHFDKHWKAVKAFKKTLKINKKHPFANYDLAVIYHRLGDRARAYKYYKKAVKINPELKTERNEQAFKYPLAEEEDQLHYSKLFLGDEDPEFTELKRDLERLENRMAQLDEPYPSPTVSDDMPEPDDDKMVTNIADLPDLDAGEEIAKPLDNELVAEALVEESDLETVEEKAPVPDVPVSPVVFITGATSGIGKATAELFAENGYSLVLTGRRAERLEALKAQLESSHGVPVQILSFDIRDLDQTNAAFDALPDVWKQVDILVNNAGLAKGMAPIYAGNFEDWNQMIDTNLKGILHMTRAITPFMVERKKGHIINVGSTSGRDVYPNGNVYCATKFAVDGLTRAIRHDLYQFNIRVSQVLPAHTETEFALVRFDWDAEKANMYQDFEPLTPRDVAEAIYFIATRPPHVNVSDVVLWSTQQLSPTVINRSGRMYKEEEE
ncbi:MAG: SDR family NAD(P)-dependent oxidoreductase [Bacteroidetes bacterium]|nr:MAG: SDR family NAD(P)-dependent oxidoreductase [Bacteroidota bacterium]